MNKNKAFLYSTGGVIAVFVILVAANFILGYLNTRVDLTDGKLYTLSDGTKSVLGKLEAPVKIRYYFSQDEQAVPLPIKGFARRIDDLLTEFRQQASGKVVIEKLDPQPDSDAEDSAALDGIEAQQLPGGEKFYMGITVSYADQKLALPTLNLDRERLVEYDLTRAIARATATDKPVVGILSPMTVFGGRGMPMMGIPPSEKWVFIGELERDFTVKPLPFDSKAIDPAVKVLLVINPRGISDETQYALDQFVLRGGRLIAFLDANAYFDQLPGPMGQQGGGTSSSLDKLLKAWGLGFDATKVVADMKFVSGSGQRSSPTVLTLHSNALNADDVSTNQIGRAFLPFAGAFTGTPVAGLNQTVLMKSSNMASLVDAFSSSEQGEKAMAGLKPTGTEYPLAIKLTGKFKTAFPDGVPKPEQAAAKGGKAPEKAAEAPLPAQLKESSGEGAVVLVGDSDFVNDGAAVQIGEVFGQRVVLPVNGNLAFAQALVDQFAGDSNLVNTRSRAVASRPFTVIREMESKAAESYLGKIKQLETSLQQTQEKLQALQKTRGPGTSAILSAEQQTELENFKKRAADARRELKEVRRDLRSDSEALQFWTKVVNIALIPLLVAIAGVVLAIVRRRRTVTI